MQEMVSLFTKFTKVVTKQMYITQYLRFQCMLLLVYKQEMCVTC